MTGVRTTVLVLDDEAPIRRAVRRALEAEGHRVLEAGSVREGLDVAAAERPDAVVLDLGLPDGSGVEFCRDFRGWSPAPILVLSARHSDSEKVALLDAGADDYVTKPFSSDELTARVRALLRRAGQPTSGASSERRYGTLMVDLAKRSVTRAGASVHLTPTEWELLRVFVSNPDRTLTHQHLFNAVWGNAFGDAQQYLRVYVGQLRRKIEDDPVRPRFIKTESAVGYRFETGE